MRWSLMEGEGCHPFFIWIGHVLDRATERRHYDLVAVCLYRRAINSKRGERVGGRVETGLKSLSGSWSTNYGLGWTEPLPGYVSSLTYGLG